MSFSVVFWRLWPKKWNIRIATFLVTLLPIAPTLVNEVTNGFGLLRTLWQATIYQLMQASGSRELYEIPSRFFSFVMASMGVAKFGWPLSGIQMTFLYIFVLFIICAIIVGARRVANQRSYVFLLLFLFFFFPIPWIAHMYYFLGNGDTEWILTRLFFALPLLFLGVGHIIGNMLTIPWMRVVGVVTLVAYTLTNLFLIADILWLNEQEFFDYQSKKEMVQRVARDAGGSSFEFVFPEGFRIGPELLYLFEVEGFPFPERINNQAEIPLWKFMPALRNGPARYTYVFAHTDSMPRVHESGTRIIFYTKRFVVYRLLNRGMAEK